MCELALTKAQSEKRKVKSESAKRKRVLTPLVKHIPQHHGHTDTQTTYCGIIALCIASCGKKNTQD